MILFKLSAVLDLCAPIPFGPRVPSSCNPLLKNREQRTNQFVICFKKKKKKSKNLSWQQGNSALAFLPYSGLNNINEMQPLSLARKITEKITECLKHWVLCNVRKPFPFIQLFTKPLQAAARCPSGSGLPRTHLCSLYWKVKVWADLAKLSIAHVSWAGCHLLFLNGSTH